MQLELKSICHHPAFGTSMLKTVPNMATYSMPNGNSWNLMFYGWIGFPCFLSGSCSPSEHPWHLPTPSPNSICFMWTALDDNFQPSPDKTLSRQCCDLPDSLPCSRRQVVSSLAHSKHAVKNNWINYIYCS